MGPRPIQTTNGRTGRAPTTADTSMSEIEIPVSATSNTDSRKQDTNRGAAPDWYDDEIAGAAARGGGDNENNDKNQHLKSDDGAEEEEYDDSEDLALLEQHCPGDGLCGETDGGEARGFLSRIWHRHWLGPDGGPWTVSSRDGDRLVLLDEAAFRLAKFLVVTAACLVIVHGYVVLAGGKRDPTYDLSAMAAYDGTAIAADAVVFFVVARLHEAPAVDTLAEVVPLLVTAIGQSWGHTHLRSLQHSITPYDIRCNWSGPMYLLIGICGSLLLALLVAHCREVGRRRRTLRALLELAGTALVFAVPLAAAGEPRAFVHVHHWYWAWFLGMHCNLHGTRWSAPARSALWGIYVNGVAVFGRDPVLGCAESLYRSRSQACPYLPGVDDARGRYYGAYTLEELAEALHPAAAVAVVSDAIGCASPDATR